MLPNLGNLRKGGKNVYQVLDITMQGIRFFQSPGIFNLIFAVAVVFSRGRIPRQSGHGFLRCILSLW